MKIAVASGKGGTGKTTISVILFKSLLKHGEDVQILDCDVEEPNLEIFLKEKNMIEEKVFSMVPEVDENLCNFCGKCKQVCEYNCIAFLSKKFLIFPELCHSCGACIYLCPKGALKENYREIGILNKSQNNNFVSGKLNIGEAMAPPLIKKVKSCIDEEKQIIIDCPPGTACSFVSAVNGVDFCILTTEPTKFGLYDMKLAIEVLKKLDIPFGVIINKSDIGFIETENYCEQQNIPILLKIPFSKKIAENYSKGEIFVENDDFINVFQKIKGILKI